MVLLEPAESFAGRAIGENALAVAANGPVDEVGGAVEQIVGAGEFAGGRGTAGDEAALELEQLGLMGIVDRAGGDGAVNLDISASDIGEPRPPLLLVLAAQGVIEPGAAESCEGLLRNRTVGIEQFAGSQSDGGAGGARHFDGGNDGAVLAEVIDEIAVGKLRDFNGVESFATLMGHALWSDALSWPPGPGMGMAVVHADSSKFGSSQ